MGSTWPQKNAKVVSKNNHKDKSNHAERLKSVRIYKHVHMNLSMHSIVDRKIWFKILKLIDKSDHRVHCGLILIHNGAAEIQKKQ